MIQKLEREIELFISLKHKFRRLRSAAVIFGMALPDTR